MRIESAPGKMSVRLFCSDLDGTLIGNPEATRRFKTAWESIPKGARPLLCYASGRLVQDVIDLLSTGVLPWPEYIIGGVGTQLYDGRLKRVVNEFNEQFGSGWNLQKVEELVGSFPGVSRQPPEFLHPYKSSWYFSRATPEAITELEKRLAVAGLEICVVYSSGRDLDVLPKNADKGGALNWLCGRFSIPLDQVLVAGDTGNDRSLFLLPGIKGIVVENAQPELIEAVVKLPTFNATQVMADGVLEGLKHFGVIPAMPHPECSTLGMDELDTTLRKIFNDAALGSLTSEERALVTTAYRHAVATVRKNITPLGFSACSLADNEVTGTDVNYRSVWARDGSITVIGTIELDDPEIRAAQKATLSTLFDHLAPNGQIPANVRLDDGKPDYSGVGGICSIDSGLWAIVAFHHYVRKTGDLEFLSSYITQLRRLMNWLCGLDSNNDHLLEIPEAGDWTDLFGRSYHILYDEILWYRANVAYARLLEMQRDFDGASECLRRSQLIRAKILETFWPSTKSVANTDRFAFAQQQAAVGDSSYLLAEITPFSFNWRCDVLARKHSGLHCKCP